MTLEARNSREPWQLVEGEFLFDEEDFGRIAKMLHDDAGIYLPEAKATLVYSRLAKRLRALGLDSFRDYCTILTEDGGRGAGERQQMLAALTTNVTRFYREPHHFDHLKAKVLPPLLEAAKRGARVRLWSATCSTGPEPYSMALTVLSLMPEAAQYDIRILATDIDPNVVATGKRGVPAVARLRFELLRNEIRQKLALGRFVPRGWRDRLRALLGRRRDSSVPRP